jgi:hypothetical protein
MPKQAKKNINTSSVNAALSEINSIKQDTNRIVDALRNAGAARSADKLLKIIWKLEVFQHTEAC